MSELIYSYYSPGVCRRIPCQSCRVRRRKCDLASPCHRCLASGLECIYIRPMPHDHLNDENLMNAPHCSDLSILEKQLEILEGDIASLKKGLHIANNANDMNINRDPNL